MNIKAPKVFLKHFKEHETKQHILFKFSTVVLIVFSYFLFMSHKYGVEHGFLVTLLTWSLFVLSTPIAGAGFLLDFPIRLVLHIKMFYSEILVWLIAISLNTYTFFFHPEMYQTTQLLSFFKKILQQPIPYWSIFLVSATGTFLSIRFGDELMNKSRHHERSFYHKHKYNHQFIITIFVFIISLTLYHFLLQRLGVGELFQ